MKIGEHIHWYITDRCNLDCSYCFKPHFPYKSQDDRNISLAPILALNDVKKVTIGGGEPTLTSNLDRLLTILKQRPIYISLHTNGLLLNPLRLTEMKGLVDDIALPLDSTKREIQKELRGEEFLPVFDRLPELASAITENNIGLRYHTVFTSLNYQDIPLIYESIKKKDFDYWRIYEFNDALPLKYLFSRVPVEDEKKIWKKIKKVHSLQGKSTPSKGYIDCLYGKFLLMDQQMKSKKDSRIQFVGRSDVHIPYAFLDNLGDLKYYNNISWGERRILGNIITDGFETVKQRLEDLHDEGLGYDDMTHDDFLEAIACDKPTWARIWEGNYSNEELEEIDPEFLDQFITLMELHNARHYPELKIKK